jgi:hypothetical protein
VPLGVLYAPGATVNARDPRHVGVVDENGDPLSLVDQFEQVNPTGNMVRTKRRLYETFRLPGTDELGTKLLLPSNQVLAKTVADQLIARQVQMAAETNTQV